MKSSSELRAKMEPFDSFWEAPENIEKGYSSFYAFYKYNYFKHFPADKASNILVISCGPQGYAAPPKKARPTSAPKGGREHSCGSATADRHASREASPAWPCGRRWIC